MSDSHQGARQTADLVRSAYGAERSAHGSERSAHGAGASRSALYRSHAERPLHDYEAHRPRRDGQGLSGAASTASAACARSRC